MREKAKIMDGVAMTRAIQRIGYEIVERNHGLNDVALIGIQRRGVPIAMEIAKHILTVENVDIPVGRLDITFYRDDLTLRTEHPVVNGTDIPFNITGKNIVIVDDVLYTGRTARAAMEALMEMGRPSTIQFAVLIDRGHRELPIRADYVGKNVPTSRHELIAVRLPDYDNERNVLLFDISEPEVHGERD